MNSKIELGMYFTKYDPSNDSVITRFVVTKIQGQSIWVRHVTTGNIFKAKIRLCPMLRVPAMFHNNELIHVG